MKNLFIIFLALLFLCCQIPEEVNKYYLENSAGMKLLQIYPDPNRLSRSHISVKRDKNIDFEDGIVYDENSFPVDGIIHTLDLSTLLGNKPAQLFLYVEWLDGAEDENFKCYFRPAELNIGYEELYCGYNVQNKLLSIVTNEDSQLEWYHDYTLPFDGRVPTSSPDYYDWNAISFRIMIYYYDNGGTINN